MLPAAARQDANAVMQSAERARALEAAIDAACGAGAASAPDVTPAALRAVRASARVCQRAELQQAVEGLLARLADDRSSQARYLALVVLDDLVMRSGAARAQVVDELDWVLQYCVGAPMPGGEPLPPPATSAQTLRRRVLSAMVRWETRFGAHFRRLPMALRYLRATPELEVPAGVGAQVGASGGAGAPAADATVAARARATAAEALAALRTHCAVMARTLALLDERAQPPPSPQPGAADSDTDDDEGWEEFVDDGGVGVGQEAPQRSASLDPALLEEVASLAREAHRTLLPAASAAATALSNAGDVEARGSNGVGDAVAAAAAAEGAGALRELRELVAARGELDALVARCVEVGAVAAEADNAGDSNGVSVAGSGASGRRGAALSGAGGWAEYLASTGGRRARRGGIGRGAERSPPNAPRAGGAAAANISHNDLALRAAAVTAAAGGDAQAAEARIQYESDRAAATAGDATQAAALQRQEIAAARAARRKRQKTSRERLRDRLMSRGAVRKSGLEAARDANMRSRNAQR